MVIPDSIDMKFRMLVRMKEGTVPVPPCRPCADAMMTSAPVRELSHRESPKKSRDFSIAETNHQISPT